VATPVGVADIRRPLALQYAHANENVTRLGKAFFHAFTNLIQQALQLRRIGTRSRFALQTPLDETEQPTGNFFRGEILPLTTQRSLRQAKAPSQTISQGVVRISRTASRG
jgi:hypothetical protein